MEWKIKNNVWNTDFDTYWCWISNSLERHGYLNVSRFWTKQTIYGRAATHGKLLWYREPWCADRRQKCGVLLRWRVLQRRADAETIAVFDGIKSRRPSPNCNGTQPAHALRRGRSHKWLSWNRQKHSLWCVRYSYRWFWRMYLNRLPHLSCPRCVRTWEGQGAARFQGRICRNCCL